MERLTYRLGEENPSYGLVDKASAKPGLFTNYDGFYAYLLATHRLGRYEDTGLTPEEITALQAERDTLKKALELMATYLVHFGRIDEMLCDDIPQPIHLKYQPKNDGNYKNEPCIQCVQEYFIKKCRR